MVCALLTLRGALLASPTPVLCAKVNFSAGDPKPVPSLRLSSADYRLKLPTSPAGILSFSSRRLDALLLPRLSPIVETTEDPQDRLPLVISYQHLLVTLNSAVRRWWWLVLLHFVSLHCWHTSTSLEHQQSRTAGCSSAKGLICLDLRLPLYSRSLSSKPKL